jgi:hypothetical protein
MEMFRNLIILEDDDFDSDLKQKKINTPDDDQLVIRWYEVLPVQCHIGPPNQKILDVYRLVKDGKKWREFLAKRLRPCESAKVGEMTFENNAL